MAQFNLKPVNWTFETTCGTTSCRDTKAETEEEMIERHKQELASAKEKAIKAKYDDRLRRQRHICDFIAKDEVLNKIHEAIGLIDENGNGMKVDNLNKAYNARLAEIADVMQKLKK